MSDPIPVPVRRRKKRVVISARNRRKLESAKRRLDEATLQILYNNPQAASVIVPQYDTLKPCSDFVEEYFAAHPELAEQTVKERKRSLGILLSFLGPRPLTRELLEQFNASLHKSDYEPGGQWLVGAIVSTFVNWLFNTKRIPEDWRRGIKFPKAVPQQPRETFEKEEIEKLVIAAEGRPIGFIVLLASHCGYALIDACNLTWASVDMEKGVIQKNRQKTGEESIVTFDYGTPMRTAMEAQREDTIRALGSIQPGFPVCRWAYGNKHSIRTLFKRLCDKAGVPYRSFHSFRATLLTELGNSDVPMAISLKVAGLKSADQLIQYVTPQPEKIREQLNRVRK